MDESCVPAFVPVDLARLDLRVGAPVLALLARYLTLLLETNKKFNLTAIRAVDQAWRRHIIDSLTLLPGLEQVAAGGTVVDVGSGGGLPGIPLAAARPDLQVTLLEATGKKARFLEQCAAELPLPNVRVVWGRAEEIGREKDHRERYDAVVCRAVGPLRELLEYTLPLAKVGGKLLALKGPSVEGELAAAGDALAVLGAGDMQVIEVYPPDWGTQSLLVSILKDRPTPRAYPRRPGVPRQEPL